jgi:hypothetical protein
VDFFSLKTSGLRKSSILCLRIKNECLSLHRFTGSVVQLVRMPPCHGGGRGFESRPVRQQRKKKQLEKAAFFYLVGAKALAATFK